MQSKKRKIFIINIIWFHYSQKVLKKNKMERERPKPSGSSGGLSGTGGAIPVRNEKGILNY